MYTKKEVMMIVLASVYGLFMGWIFSVSVQMFVSMISASFALYFFSTHPVAVMGSIVRSSKPKAEPLKVVKFPSFK